MYDFSWSRRTKADTEAARLSEFLQDLMVVGSLKGFKYLDISIRGREELLLRVRNDYLNPPTAGQGEAPNSLMVLNSSVSKGRALVSAKTQYMMQSTSPVLQPPISLIDDDLVKDTQYTSFLIAAYSRYRCPYVWLRSNHERLIRIKENQTIETENPLKLESTSCWKQFDIRPWDIIVEVVCLTLRPQPENPFAIDHEYFDRLPLEEVVVRTGAMVRFLQRMSVRHYYFSDSQDLEKLQLRHYESFCELMAARRTMGSPPFT
ncbi:hypothetical protein BJ085DRAFT_36123 [Dimargaris cristalligena]|uniref:DUF7886 domain-containing protein n=1 Tax=Dimargaris cristalligena TaxID=215637 RepID=A0A4P9ZWP8_9FUNG|nr:hypothetical protein BJ085DRAFT_36123 [Dimargaris cristalligena]|eukprot:RKP38043.1 hypothetical protein BJ085DRAFT_36123 [Dimargaris cristalligena]